MMVKQPSPMLVIEQIYIYIYNDVTMMCTDDILYPCTHWQSNMAGQEIPFRGCVHGKIVDMGSFRLFLLLDNIEKTSLI